MVIKKIIFYIEHIARELDFAIHSSRILKEQFGIECKIRSITFHSFMMYFEKADAYVLPYTLHDKDWPIRLILELNNNIPIIVNLNWEQRLIPSSIKFRAPNNNFVRNNIIQYSWDNEFTQFLRKNSVKSKNILQMGNLNFFLIAQYFQNKMYFKKKVYNHFGFDINKKLLFIPINYAWAFKTKSDLKFAVKKGFTENEVNELTSYASECLNMFVIFINEIIDSKQYNILIRPHPSISTKKYLNLIKESDNLVISKDFSVNSLLSVSSIVVSSWSTTALLSKEIGLPSFLFTPIKRPSSLNSDWHSTILNIKDYVEFSSLLKSYQIVSKQRLIKSYDFTLLIENILRKMESFDTSKFNNHRFISKKSILKTVKSFFYYKFKYIPENLAEDYFRINKNIMDFKIENRTTFNDE